MAFCVFRRRRSLFRGDGDRDSELIPITIPRRLLQALKAYRLGVLQGHCTM
jgi:hypothetical protein